MSTPIHARSRLLTHPVVGEWSSALSENSIKHTLGSTNNINETAQTLVDSSGSADSQLDHNLGYIGRCSERLWCREGSCQHLTCQQAACPTSQRLLKAASWTSWWSESQ